MSTKKKASNSIKRRYFIVPIISFILPIIFDAIIGVNTEFISNLKGLLKALFWGFLSALLFTSILYLIEQTKDKIKLKFLDDFIKEVIAATNNWMIYVVEKNHLGYILNTLYDKDIFIVGKGNKSTFEIVSYIKDNIKKEEINIHYFITKVDNNLQESEKTEIKKKSKELLDNGVRIYTIGKNFIYDILIITDKYNFWHFLVSADGDGNKWLKYSIKDTDISGVENFLKELKEITTVNFTPFNGKLDYILLSDYISDYCTKIMRLEGFICGGREPSVLLPYNPSKIFDRLEIARLQTEVNRSFKSISDYLIKNSE